MTLIKRLKRISFASLLCILAIACSSDATGPSFNLEEDCQNVTTINGERPPGDLLPLQDSFTMLDTIDADGNRLVVTQGVRKAGTRVGIHVHEYGGHTCVMSGEITDFIEGIEPKTYSAGECYYMPPNVLMTAAHLGSEDAILIDTFTLPDGEHTISICEPGYPSS